MAEAPVGGGQEGGRSTVSAVGAFVVGLVLGAGLLLIFHAVTARRLLDERDKLMQEMELTAKGRIEAKSEVAKLQTEVNQLEGRVKELEKKLGIKSQ